MIPNIILPIGNKEKEIPNNEGATRFYEKYVIRPILDVIEKYQDYLCKSENLNQLAKLGFMFENLWYAGRVAYGNEGKIFKSGQCENNPKYEIGDSIEYNSEKNENLVYDAWGMHISDSELPWDEFAKIVNGNVEISEVEKKRRKSNKTFDEWVEIFTNKNYRYRSLYPNRKSVADFLLCVIGNGYGYNKESGFIFEEASGADQDEAIYGEWETSKFEIEEIQNVVKSVMSDSRTKEAITCKYDALIEYKKQEEEKERKMFEDIGLNFDNKIERTPEEEENLTKKINDILKSLNKEGINLSEELKEESEDSNPPEYYPICNYSAITQFDEKTHPSYLKEAVKICKDITSFPKDAYGKKDDHMRRTGNYDFAIKFLKKDFVKPFLNINK